MMIRGEAELFYLYPDGTKVPATGIEKNTICWPMLRQMFLYSGQSSYPTKRDATSQSSTALYRWQLFYGTKDIKSTPLNAWYNHDAVIDVDQDTPFWTDAVLPTDPDVVTLTALIPAPTVSARTIKVLGITWSGSSGGNGNVFNRLNGKFTILRLSTPCVQDINVQLLVTYRLYFYPVKPTSASNVSNMDYVELRRLVKALCDATALTQIQGRALLGRMASSAYDLDSLPTFGFRSENFSSGASSEHELTDAGLIHADGHTGLSVYNNVLAFTKTYTATHNPSMGTFLRNIVLGEAGWANNGTSVSAFNRPLFYEDAVGGITNPIQATYLQRNTPVGPFQDLTPTAMGTMTGQLTFDHSGFVDQKFPAIFRVRIVTGGSMATPATYQVDVMEFSGGFAGNRWIPRTAILPQSLNGLSNFRAEDVEQERIYEDYIEYGGTVYRSPDKNKFVLAAGCQRDKSGVTIYNVRSGSKKNFNANTTPALPVTNVSDVEGSKGYSFIACSMTGLWRISPDQTTVEHITSPTGTDKAYQISVKNDANGTLWVLFDGGLCKLTNPDAAVGSLSWTIHNASVGSPTFSYTGITDANWDKVTSMVINPDNAGDDQFLFVTSTLTGGSTAGSYRLGFVWWSTGTGTAVNPSTAGIGYGGFTWNETNLLRIIDSIICVNGRWIASGGTAISTASSIHHFTYGANTLNANVLNGTLPCRAVPFYLGNVAAFTLYATSVSQAYSMPVVLASSLATIVGGSTLNIANAGVEFMLREGSTTYDANINATNIPTGNLTCPLMFLSEGNWIFSHERNIQSYGVTPFVLQPTNAKYNTYKNLFWKTYGWNGSSWELGHASARDVHAGLQALPGSSGVQISFADGVSGTSFVANEFWNTIIGRGLMKDNGTTDYTFTMSICPEPTEDIAVNSTVPLSALGALVDEPVCFSSFTPDASTTLPTTNNNTLRRCIQNKGIVVQNALGNTSNNALLISDQLIPASTDFDFRFKWISFEGGGSGATTYKAIGMATGTTTFTYNLNFQYNPSTGQVQLYNNSTAVGSPISNPDPTKEFRIQRVGSTITAYYDGGVIGSITSASAMVIMGRGSDGTHETGWYDMKLSYTEARRVMRVGDNLLGTGSYNAKFAGLTCTGLVGDTKLYFGSGSPLQAVLEFTHAGIAVSGTGKIKVASGSGWLIFHDSETANPVTGTVKAHYVLTLQP